MCKIQEKMMPFGLLWLRVSAGMGIASHGYGKIFGGGMDGFAQGVAGMGFPAPEFFAWAAALSEFGGGIFLALGLVSQIAALMVFITMTVAVFVTHAADPFAKKELALAYWVITGSFVLMGPGRLSLDAILCRKKESTAAAS